MKVDPVTLIYAILIVVAIFIIGILCYYYLPTSSWITFKLNYGDTFQSSTVSASLKNVDPSKLRWRNCMFTVVYNKTTYTSDVTAFLNMTTTPYLYYNKTSFDYDLIRPLNYLSFPIAALATIYNKNRPTVTPCIGDVDCTSISLGAGGGEKYPNNMCIKTIPLLKDNTPVPPVPTAKNCTFSGSSGTTTALTSFEPVSDTTYSIGINVTNSADPVYSFPDISKSKYATSIPYNTIYCALNSDNETYTVDWLQLVSGSCSLAGLANAGDSVTLTGSFRVFPYL